MLICVGQIINWDGLGLRRTCPVGNVSSVFFFLDVRMFILCLAKCGFILTLENSHAEVLVVLCVEPNKIRGS